METFTRVVNPGDPDRAGLPRILERFPPAQVLWSGPPGGTLAARTLQVSLAKTRIPVRSAENGQILDLGAGARLKVLAVCKRGAVLLLAESGYAPATPPEWIEKLRLQVILLSVGAGDRAGRPDAEVLEAVRGYKLLRTDWNGWMVLSTDGEKMWLEFSSFCGFFH